ncbi:MAG: M23 family metallopeptidase [Rhodospirillaceae bacterium]
MGIARFLIVGFLAATAISLPSNGGVAPAWAAGESQSPALGLPIACRLGETCWLVNLVDLDAGPGVRDFTCGAHSYNGHTGVDIAIRDYSKMDDGVAVVAAAAGTVTRVRDGMLDGDVSKTGHGAVSGRGCGNAVFMDHGNGWHTNYCHLRRNSLVVRPGQRIAQGDKLGLVGSSGLAEFPHIHMGVRFNRKVVDPFIGLDRKADCGPGLRPLWDDRTLAGFGGGMTALYDAGFSPVKVNADALRRGFYRDAVLSAKSDGLIFWVDAFWVHDGDKLTLKITAPDGRVMASETDALKKTQARYMKFIGKRRTVDWKHGLYRGEAELIRQGAGGQAKVFKIERQVEIK